MKSMPCPGSTLSLTRGFVASLALSFLISFWPLLCYSSWSNPINPRSPLKGPGALLAYQSPAQGLDTVVFLIALTAAVLVDLEVLVGPNIYQSQPLALITQEARIQGYDSV